MTLPSNASMHEFPSNATSHFTTRLRERIEMDGAWEVALVEASIPTRWSSLLEENFIRQYIKIPARRSEIDGEEQTETSISSSYRWVRAVLPADGIHSTKQLVSAMNVTIRSIRAKIYSKSPTWSEEHEVALESFSYDNRKFTTQLIDRTQISGHLAMILGIGDAMKRWVDIDTDETDFSVDLRRGVHHVFVYSDLAQYVPVGDTSAPLLRIIPLVTRGEESDQYTHIFDHPHYIPVSRRSIETIQIDLRSDIGKYIPFVSGKSIVKLHFRRRRPL